MPQLTRADARLVRLGNSALSDPTRDSPATGGKALREGTMTLNEYIAALVEKKIRFHVRLWAAAKQAREAVPPALADTEVQVKWKEIWVPGALRPTTRETVEVIFVEGGHIWVSESESSGGWAGRGPSSAQ
jgi:hypothetical protein